MEVVFVLYDVLKKACMEVFTRIFPILQAINQSLLFPLQRAFRNSCGDFFDHSVFSCDWRYMWELVIKTIQSNWIVIMVLLALVYYHRKNKVSNVETKGKKKLKKYNLSDICNLIKNCEKPSFVSNALYVFEEIEIDFNSRLPNSKSGLTPFLCACISGSRELVEYMLQHGADINCRSFYQDSPLHIATFACASQYNKEFKVLATLIEAGCRINSKNWIGNTPLCVAAPYDTGELIRFLIAQGADPSICNNNGIYPIDFATNAGHQHLTRLLRFKVSDSHVWDFIEPHTPPRIKLGLQTPCKKHLADSSFTATSKRKLNTFRTPRPGRSLSIEMYRKSKR